MFRPKATQWAHLALFGVALFYSLNYFIAKLAVGVISPFGLTALRALTGLSFFYVWNRLAGWEKIRDRKDFGLLALCALLGAVLNQWCFFGGMSFTTEVNAAVLMTTTPIFVFLTAWALRQESMNYLRALGILVAFAGAALLSLNGRSLEFGAQTFLGDALIILNAASYGVYLVIVRPLMQKYQARTVLMWLFVFGSMVNIPAGSPSLFQVDPAHLSPEILGAIAYILIFATMGTYALNAFALVRVPSSLVGAYIYLQPALVSFMEVFFLKRSLSGEKLAYMLLICVGVALVSINKKEKLNK
ncbi:MAG: DMT family transporter [Bacteroidota bacterium]